jgi:hypothetical protein
VVPGQGDDICRCGHPAGCPARTLRELPDEQVRTRAEQIWAAAPARGPVRGPLRAAGHAGSVIKAAARGRRERRRGWWRGLLLQALLIAMAGAITGQVAGAGVDGEAQVVCTLAGMAGAYWWMRRHPSAGALWRRRVTAERRTAAKLRALSRAGYLVMHDPAVPGSPPDADLLVIGPTGVWVLASERWRRSGRLAGSAESPPWLTAAAATVRGGAEAIRAAAGTAPGIRFRPLLCLHGGRIPDHGAVIGDVLVVAPRQLVKVIGRGPLLTERTVAVVARQVLAALRPER